jgi:hypothetical protein
MKNFVKENWYKLMVGSSMMMASFGFMMYAISPAYSNNNENKVEIPSSQNTTSPVGSNGVIVGDNVYFVDGGYVYRNMKDLGGYWDEIAPAYSGYGWTKFKLP